MPEYAGWIPQSNCKHKIPSRNIPVKTRIFSYRQVCIVPLTLPFFWQENATRTCGCCSNQKPQLTATNKLQKNKSLREFGNNNNNSWLQTKKADGLCLHLVFYCFLQNHLHMMRTTTTTTRSPWKQRFGSLPGQSFLCMSCRHRSGRPRCRLLREWHRVCLLPLSASSNPSASKSTSSLSLSLAHPKTKRTLFS